MRHWVWVALLVPFGSPFAEELARGCDGMDKQCLAPVVSFLNVKSKESTDFMMRAYRSLRRHASAGEKADLDSEQENWRANARRYCRNVNDPLSNASCFGDQALLRGIELDERLAEVMAKQKRRYALPPLPMKFRQSALGLSLPDATYYENTDILDVERAQHGAFRFSFHVSGGNQHICAGEGNAQHRGYAFTRVADPDKPVSEEEKNLNRKCVFEIKVFPNHVRIGGNYECHAYFGCGARIVLDYAFVRTKQ